ncbi:unnamed protein product [Soboliphyme baturini]|uniref:2'-phosphotransferase n=1 Tax=Soboliphyme baturini TaxID=241478 RepID=A0A183J436_9BILA|nr:unnamed protein product [Soboliphyme baturini]
MHDYAKSQLELTRKTQIGKKLAYMLRYGALREGLDVTGDGYVSLTELCEHPLFACLSTEELLREIRLDAKRFELMAKESQYKVRARYGRKFLKSPYHEGTKVKRLLEILIVFIRKHIQLYDFEEFPDGYLISLIIKRLKLDRDLSDKVLRQLLCPAISHLDLCNAFVNKGTIALIPTKCPYVTWLSFRGLGFVITDHVLALALKVCTFRL